jgi:hypothetical protein
MEYSHPELGDKKQEKSVFLNFKNIPRISNIFALDIRKELMEYFTPPEG